MKEYKTDPEFYNSLSDEQKEMYNADKEQHEKYVANSLSEKTEAEKKEFMENYKKEYQETFLKEQEAKKSRDNFVSTAPKENQKIIKDFFDDGHDESWIKENHPELLEVKKEKPRVDLENLMNGKVSSPSTDKVDETPKETDEQFLKRVHDKGIADPKSKDWDRYFALTQK